MYLLGQYIRNAPTQSAKPMGTRYVNALRRLQMTGLMRTCVSYAAGRRAPALSPRKYQRLLPILKSVDYCCCILGLLFSVDLLRFLTPIYISIIFTSLIDV